MVQVFATTLQSVCNLCSFSQIFASCWLDTLQTWLKLSKSFDYLEELPEISFCSAIFVEPYQFFHQNLQNMLRKLLHTNYESLAQIRATFAKMQTFSRRLFFLLAYPVESRDGLCLYDMAVDHQVHLSDVDRRHVQVLVAMQLSVRRRVRRVSVVCQLQPSFNYTIAADADPLSLSLSLSLSVSAATTTSMQPS